MNHAEHNMMDMQPGGNVSLSPSMATNNGSMDHSTMDHSTMDHGSMDMSHSMMMYFHFAVESTILFKGWQTETVAALIGSMVAIFFMSFIYEGLKYFREYLFKKSIQRSQSLRKDTNVMEDQTVQYFDQVFIPSPVTMISSTHFIQTVLHVIQFVLSYFLMLIFMTYNVWLCLAVSLGSATGYFCFGWRKSVVVDVTEHCH